MKNDEETKEEEFDTKTALCFSCSFEEKKTKELRINLTDGFFIFSITFQSSKNPKMMMMRDVERTKSSEVSEPMLPRKAAIAYLVPVP